MSTINEGNQHHNPYLNKSARPIFVVCRLMRQLPDDITNAPSLTLDEAKKRLLWRFTRAIYNGQFWKAWQNSAN